MDCWRKADTSALLNLTELGNIPCGGSEASESEIVPCCKKGDVCMSDNICYFNHLPPKGHFSGYYIAGCTDETLKDPACTMVCSITQRPAWLEEN